MKCDKCGGTGNVENPVPEWIVDALAPLPYEHLKNVAAAFRALVAERAKAAAQRLSREAVPSFKTWEGHAAPIIREEFLR